MSQLRGYQVIELLGQGTYGRVYKVLRKSDQQVVVLKSVPFQGMSAQEQQETLNEVRVMAQVQHAHVIQYLDSFLENGVLNIVMEYAPQGDLAQKLEERRRQARPFSESDLWEYFVDVALGLKHLHEKRILHRDIKPHNIFLDANGRAKVGDLGLGRMLGSKSVHARSGVGTPLYFSPELCEDRPYDDKSDIWGLGCLLYELAALRPPFEASNQIALAKKIVSETPPALPAQYSPELRFLVAKLLEKDAARRPDVNQILHYSPVRRLLDERHLRDLEASLRAQFAERERHVLQAQADAERRAEEAEAEAQAQRQRAQELESEAGELRQELADALARARDAEDAAAARESECAALRVEVDTLTSELRAAAASSVAQGASLATAAQRVADLTAQLEDAKAALVAARDLLQRQARMQQESDGPSDVSRQSGPAPQRLRGSGSRDLFSTPQFRSPPVISRLAPAARKAEAAESPLLVGSRAVPTLGEAAAPAGVAAAAAREVAATAAHHDEPATPAAHDGDGNAEDDWLRGSLVRGSIREDAGEDACEDAAEPQMGDTPAAQPPRGRQSNEEQDEEEQAMAALLQSRSPAVAGTSGGAAGGGSPQPTQARASRLAGTPSRVVPREELARDADAAPADAPRFSPAALGVRTGKSEAAEEAGALPALFHWRAKGREDEALELAPRFECLPLAQCAATCLVVLRFRCVRSVSGAGCEAPSLGRVAAWSDGRVAAEAQGLQSVALKSAARNERVFLCDVGVAATRGCKADALSLSVCASREFLFAHSLVELTVLRNERALLDAVAAAFESEAVRGVATSPARRSAKSPPASRLLAKLGRARRVADPSRPAVSARWPLSEEQVAWLLDEADAYRARAQRSHALSASSLSADAADFEEARRALRAAAGHEGASLA